MPMRLALLSFHVDSLYPVSLPMSSKCMLNDVYFLNFLLFDGTNTETYYLMSGS